MIRRLRWKMVAAMMLVVALVLGVACALFYASTSRDIRRASEEMLVRVISGELARIAGGPGEPLGGEQGPNAGLAYFLIVTDLDGGVLDTAGDEFQFAVDSAELAGQILAQPSDEGKLADYNLRYLRQQTQSGWRIACHDLTFENALKRSTLRTCLLVGGGAMALFFGLSLILSAWATRPVGQAWDRQRQFVADASHELKTPLTVILSNADLLAGPQSAPGQAARWVDNIRAEGGRMRRLIESMLFLARSDAAQAAASPRVRCDWSDTVESGVLTFEPVIFERGLSIQSRVEQGCFVRGCADDLRRLFDILLDNAAKYTLPGGCITVTLRKEGGRWAGLTVSNPAHDIDPAQAKKLFDRFYRLDPARTGPDGYGLGLPIAKSLTRAMKGKIWMRSQQGVVSFFVRLPLDR